MKLLFTFSLLFTCFTFSFSQFPENWVGKYSGKMLLSSVSAPSDSIDVSLEINTVHTDSVWTYNMSYVSQRIGKIEKNYFIVRRNGQYLMNEGNGILIEMSYMNNSFYEFYTVEGMIFSTIMRKSGQDIYFEIFGANEKPTLLSESTPEGDDNTVYKVNSLKPTFVQSVLLKPSH